MIERLVAQHSLLATSVLLALFSVVTTLLGFIVARRKDEAFRFRSELDEFDEKLDKIGERVGGLEVRMGKFEHFSTAVEELRVSVDRHTLVGEGLQVAVGEIRSFMRARCDRCESDIEHLMNARMDHDRQLAEQSTRLIQLERP